jgi:hypothetical protein
METSGEKKRNCWLILRVYLLGSWGSSKGYVLEMDFFILWVERGY